MHFQKTICAIFLLVFHVIFIFAQEKDSTRRNAIFHAHRIDSTYNKLSDSKIYRMLRLPVPLFAISAITYSQGSKFRTMRNTYTPNFSYHYDDFLQYTPLAAVFGLKLAGVEGRSSWSRMLVSDVLSAAIMATAVNSLKYTVKRTRPDGSANNSFPSGHTATAFMAATIMHHEYGLTRSPLYSIGGYTVATATAFSRQLNNKHWLSDVLAGAGIGILSTELGYLLTDLLFKDKGLILKNRVREEAPLHGRPSFLEYGVGYGIINGSIEIGKHIRLSSPGATHVSVKGGYFFTPYIGFGGEISALASPLAFDMSLYDGTATPDKYELLRIYSDPTGIFSFTTGPYFSLPVAGKLLLGTKFQAGYGYHIGNQVKMDLRDLYGFSTPVRSVVYMEGKSNGSMVVRTGISALGIINRNLAFRMYIDYDYSLLHAPYKIVTDWDLDTPVYSETQYSKHHLHYITLGAAVTALFW